MGTKKNKKKNSVLWSSRHDRAGSRRADLHQGAVQHVHIVEEVNSCHHNISIESYGLFGRVSSDFDSLCVLILREKWLWAVSDSL